MQEMTVAVKIPEVDFDNAVNAEAAKKDLTREMRTMHSFNHHNIVKLIRVSESKCTQKLGRMFIHVQGFLKGGGGGGGGGYSPPPPPPYNYSKKRT